MKRVFLPRDVDIRRYRVGPLGPYIDRLAARLSEEQFGRDTAIRKIRCVADLSVWLDRRRLGTESLDEQSIKAFLCCRRRYDPARAGDTTALKGILELLRELGVAPPPPPAKASRRHPIEASFERYLREERRLSQSSLLVIVPFVRQFLTDGFGNSSTALDELQPSDVTRFVLRCVRTLGASRAKLLAWALRSFFRFLVLRGETASDLSGALPAVADWRLSSVPKGLEPWEVRCLLSSCDRRMATGRRDYAVLLLLARLGIRAGEVTALTLDDIHWDIGELTIRGKGSRSDRLPLPDDVGEALVAYLRCGRPRSATTRRLFYTARAPVRELADPGAVGCIVRRAVKRAGIDSQHKGAHVLRHALATEMLRRGASLPEIGELLRHRRLDTTAIYAKVDREALRALAPAWPGERA